MPLAARIPERTPIERALRAYTAYVEANADRLAAAAPGAEPEAFPAVLGGEFARQIDERDFDLALGGGISAPTARVDVIVGVPFRDTFVDDARNRARVTVWSSHMPGATSAQRDHYTASMYELVESGSLSSGWEIADRELLSLALLEVRPAEVYLEQRGLLVPILNQRGRMLDAFSRFDDALLAWQEVVAIAGRTGGYERAAMDTVKSFVANIDPIMHSALRNPARFAGDMQALGRNYSELFGDARPTRRIDMLIRHKIGAFVTVPERLASELERHLADRPASSALGRLQARDYAKVTERIAESLHRPGVGRELG